MKSREMLVAGAAVSVLSLSAVAGTPPAEFVAGQWDIAGTAFSPDAPPDVVNLTGDIGSNNGIADGSVNSGPVDASISMSASITHSQWLSRVDLNGFAMATQPEGHMGNAFISLETDDVIPFTLRVYEPLFFTLENTAGLVSFDPETGSIEEDMLMPGDYTIIFSFSVSLSEGQTLASNALDWSLLLTPLPGPSAAMLLALAMPMLGSRRRRN